eukprot:576050-Hanusia_phi.AAC.1
MERQGDGTTALHLAARLGHQCCLKELIRCQSDVNVRSNEGSTCAHAASEGGNTQVLRYLVEAAGPDLLRQADNVGCTCAVLASSNGHTETL